MNSRFTLALALLLSGVSSAAFAECPKSDRDCTKSDLAQMMCDCREANSKLTSNTEFVKVAVGTLVAEKFAAELACDKIAHSARKFLKKYVLNHLLFQDAVNVTLDLPSLGRTTVLNTDQFLEVLLVVLADVLHKKSTGTVVVDGGLTLAREEIVAIALWLLGQSNVEELLPESVTDGIVYQEGRNELLRHYVDKGIEHVRH